MTNETYSSWTGIAQAIKTVARGEAAGRAGGTTSAILQAHFDRFLSRVFADGEDSEWMLKGGIGMLARVPRARSTTDVDLAASNADLDQAVESLQQLVGRNLGDHLRFDLVRVRPTGQGDNQPGVLTRKVLFACRDAATGKKVGEISVDVVVGPPPVGRIEVVEPANRLRLPKPLQTYPYRLYPVADQIADKVCATMTPSYGGRPSSRVKDLIDLAILVRTQRVGLRELQLAIDAKRVLSNIPPITSFEIPDGWGPRYRALAIKTPELTDLADVQEAQQLVADMIRPALNPGAVSTELEWSPAQGWTEPGRASGTAAAEDQDEPAGAEGEVWVRPHQRSGRPVVDHYRRRRSDRR